MGKSTNIMISKTFTLYCVQEGAGLVLGLGQSWVRHGGAQGQGDNVHDREQPVSYTGKVVEDEQGEEAGNQTSFHRYLSEVQPRGGW